MRADRLLHALARSDDERLDASGVAMVVAHPDDETLILGGHLHRLRGLRLVVVTDGAPPDGRDARRRGFSDSTSYAAARRHELAVALACAGHPASAATLLGLPDQGVARTMGALARVLRGLVAGARTVITHAFEGGHPDHDAVAFAVRTAVDGMPPGTRPAVVEAPLYRRGADGAMAARSFGTGDPGLLLDVADEGLARKRQMLAAHATQRAVLAMFPNDNERLRVSPSHEFGSLPNGGALWYEGLGWGIDGGAWLAAVRAARTS